MAEISSGLRKRLRIASAPPRARKPLSRDRVGVTLGIMSDSAGVGVERKI